MKAHLQNGVAWPGHVITNRTSSGSPTSTGARQARIRPRSRPAPSPNSHSGDYVAESPHRNVDRAKLSIDLRRPHKFSLRTPGSLVVQQRRPSSRRHPLQTQRRMARGS